jgi:hypothetical protein
MMWRVESEAVIGRVVWLADQPSRNGDRHGPTGEREMLLGNQYCGRRIEVLEMHPFALG